MLNNSPKTYASTSYANPMTSPHTLFCALEVPLELNNNSLLHQSHPVIENVVTEMELRSTNIGYGLGHALGEILGTHQMKVAPLDYAADWIFYGIKSAYDSIYNSVSNILLTSKELLPNSETRNNIEQALDSENVIKIKEACHTNDAAEMICVKTLNNLLSYDTMFSTKELNKVEALLVSGVQFDSALLHRKAIFTQDSALVDTISHLGIKSHISGSWINMVEYYNQLIVNPEYKEFASKFSDVFSDPILVERIKGMLEHHYEQIMNEIHKAKNENSGKPLLILMGEMHTSINCLLSEIITVCIAKYELNIDVLHSELFSKVTMEKSYGSGSKEFVAAVSMLEVVAEQLGMKYQAIDIGNCVVNFSDGKQEIDDILCHESDSSDFLNEISPTSEEGRKLRNKLMAKELISRNGDRDTIALVGANHLVGMCDDENLQNHFNIVTINMVPELKEAQPTLYLQTLIDITLEHFFDTQHTFTRDIVYVLPTVDGLYLTFEQYTQLIKNIVQNKNMFATECKEFESFTKDQLLSLGFFEEHRDFLTRICYGVIYILSIRSLFWCVEKLLNNKDAVKNPRPS